MLICRNGSLWQTPEIEPLRLYLCVLIGDEVRVFDNLFEVDGEFLMLPEPPSKERH